MTEGSLHNKWKTVILPDLHNRIINFISTTILIIHLQPCHCIYKSNLAQGLSIVPLSRVAGD